MLIPFLLIPFLFIPFLLIPYSLIPYSLIPFLLIPFLLIPLFAFLSLQTTIEFYLNLHEKHDAKLEGMIFKNPFDMGWRKNLRRVFGDVPWYLALSLSWRKPSDPEYAFLPQEIVEFASMSSNGSEYRKYGVISRV